MQYFPLNDKMLLVFGMLFLSVAGRAQIDTVLFSLSAQQLFPEFPIKSSYTTLFDRRPGQHFLYSANLEEGLGIYDISSPDAVTTVLDYGIAHFNNLDVAAIQQRGDALFVGLGDFHVNTNAATGLAMLDISNPATPVVKTMWDSTAFKHGITHIAIEGDYAYLATMKDGIIILNISDENHIVFESSLQLDLNFPAPSGNAHNARGLALKNDTLYVCFDRGGLRVVDVSDKKHPVEVYKYINQDLNASAAAAYNGIAIKDHYAFLAVDYCGMEVVDIGSIPFQTVQWYNPWGCNATNWSGAAIHTNELVLGHNDSLLFVSAGQSDLLVFDVTDPENTRKIGEYTYINDTLASNGLDVFQNRVSLSFLHTPFFIPLFTPFFSDPGGIKMLDYKVMTAVAQVKMPEPDIGGARVFPNPVNGHVKILSESPVTRITIFDILGREIFTWEPIPDLIVPFDLIPGIQKGLYLIEIDTLKGRYLKKAMVDPG